MKDFLNNEMNYLSPALDGFDLAGLLFSLINILIARGHYKSIVVKNNLIKYLQSANDLSFEDEITNPDSKIRNLLNYLGYNIQRRDNIFRGHNQPAYIYNLTLIEKSPYNIDT